jgi:hypothetical protein
MAYEQIGIYLNDHLAGSVVVLELLEHLEKEHAGTDVERLVINLRADIVADRKELEALMERLQIAQSPPRKAAAWLGEKVTEFKLRVNDPAGGPLRLLEALEAVQIGIEGKRALWRAMMAAARYASELQVLDYERLAEQAVEQHRRVEAVRVEAAAAALIP